MASLTTRLSLQQYILWNENRTINPKTGKKIKPGGPTYNEIEEGWNKLQASNKFTRNECIKWVTDKTVNPKTNKPIKEGGFTYEMIRNKCEVYDIDTKETGKFYNSIIDGSNSGSSCGSSSSGSGSDSDGDDNPLSVKTQVKTPLSLVCFGEKCMMKGCPWNGSYGINFSLFPKMFIKAVSFMFPYLNPKRCCCFCFGHMILFLSFVGSKTTASCIPRDVKELTKVQTTIDKLESVEGSLSDNVKKIFIREANIELSKSASSVFKKGLPVLNTLMYQIQENSSSIFRSISNGLSSAVEMFMCQD